MYWLLVSPCLSEMSPVAPYELFVYPGAGHTNVDPFARSPIFYARVRAWYAKYGLL